MNSSGEANPPQHGATIVGNAVYGNNNGKTAAIDIAQLAIGNGILIAGGNDNVVQRNLVYDHDLVGIGVIPLPEKVISPDDPKAINFDARRNRVVANVVRQSRAADLGLVTSITDPTDAGHNCFSRNHVSSSLPVGLQKLVACGHPASRASCASLCARPPRSDATPKRASPLTNTSRRPMRSAARPPSRRKPANARV